MDKPKCMCCGNTIYNRGIGMINSYWLQGREWVYSICPECHDKPFRQFIFLLTKKDLTEDLIKKYKVCWRCSIKYRGQICASTKCDSCSARLLDFDEMKEFMMVA